MTETVIHLFKVVYITDDEAQGPFIPPGYMQLPAQFCLYPPAVGKACQNVCGRLPLQCPVHSYLFCHVSIDPHMTTVI